MDLIDSLPWPAMIVTVIAAYLVGSRTKGRRKVGFWAFLLSNALWISWGMPNEAYALVVLQVALAVLNIRGAYKNESGPHGTVGH